MTFFTPKFLSIHPNFRMTFFHYCTNSLSSLHISSHHCTFCASLHVKTSPDRRKCSSHPFHLHATRTRVLKILHGHLFVSVQYSISRTRPIEKRQPRRYTDIFSGHMQNEDNDT